MPARCRKQLLIRTSIGRVQFEFKLAHWSRQRARGASAAARYETSLLPSIFNPEDLDGSLRGESIKGKSFSFTSAVPRVQTFSFFPFLSFAEAPSSSSSFLLSFSFSLISGLSHAGCYDSLETSAGQRDAIIRSTGVSSSFLLLFSLLFSASSSRDRAIFHEVGGSAVSEDLIATLGLSTHIVIRRSVGSKSL